MLSERHNKTRSSRQRTYHRSEDVTRQRSRRHSERHTRRRRHRGRRYPAGRRFSRMALRCETHRLYRGRHRPQTARSLNQVTPFTACYPASFLAPSFIGPFLAARFASSSFWRCALRSCIAVFLSCALPPGNTGRGRSLEARRVVTSLAVSYATRVTYVERLSG